MSASGMTARRQVCRCGKHDQLRRLGLPRRVGRPILCVTTTRAPTKPELRYVGLRHSVCTGAQQQASSAWAVLQEGRLAVPTISKSDEAFAEQGIEFVRGHEGIDLAELNGLFVKVGFPVRDLDKLQRALENTHLVMWIRSSKGSRWAKVGQLLGFARATSDRALTAVIWDVAVDPGWQRGGLGRALVERLTAGLIQENITTISLFAEPNVVGMYEKLGFQQNPAGIKAMAFQSKAEGNGPQQKQRRAWFAAS